MQEKFDTINSNLESLKNHILREISALHVKFDKLIDLLIANQITNIRDHEKHAETLKSKILEKDIKEMKPLAKESDINNLE